MITSKSAYKEWMAATDVAHAKMVRMWNEHIWGGVPLPYIEPSTYVAVDRSLHDNRRVLFDLETGRPIAACVNQDALDAATRLLGDSC